MSTGKYDPRKFKTVSDILLSMKSVDNLSQFKCKFKNYLCMSP